MIHYIKGNLLESEAEALVNTVNTVGVMGKGIALQFREQYPENYRVYKNACANNELRVGKMLVVDDSSLTSGKKTIINFPTKIHWRRPSEYSYIEEGLKALRSEIEERGISSIAIPPLGSHNGGLDWRRVKQMIEDALCDIACDVYLYEPSEAISERMKAERTKLTPARAMLLTMMGDLTRNGEFASVFAAEKIIYFLQRFGAEHIFKIKYMPYFYGPYSGGKVAHVLYALNGSYIRGMGGMNNRPFDYIWLLDDTEEAVQKYFAESSGAAELLAICDRTKAFLRDYYSNYSLELLSSVDFLLESSPSLRDWRSMDEENVVDTLTHEIQQWSRRKEQMFKKNQLKEAYKYLKTY